MQSKIRHTYYCIPFSSLSISRKLRRHHPPSKRNITHTVTQLKCVFHYFLFLPLILAKVSWIQYSMSPPQNPSKDQTEREKIRKKLQSQKQRTLFGLPKCPVTVMKMKKVAKNQFKKVDEFVRTETSTVSNSAGLFTCMCDCLKQFRNVQGMNQLALLQFWQRLHLQQN